MSLEEQIKEITNNLDCSSSEKFLEILNQIKPHFKNPLIPEYLDGKIQKINDSETEAEKMKQCKALMPYFDWYLQGR